MMIEVDFSLPDQGGGHSEPLPAITSEKERLLCERGRKMQMAGMINACPRAIHRSGFHMSAIA